MTAVILLGLAAGLGSVGVVAGLRQRTPTLESVASALDRPRPGAARPSSAPGPPPSGPIRIATAALDLGERAGLDTHPRWRALLPSLDILGETRSQLASKMLVAAGAGLVVPPLLWTAALIAGVRLPPATPVICTLLAVPAGFCLPVVSVARRAAARRRHFRAVIGTFVDLVVLSLAGGVGIEGALVAASQVSSDWAARRMSSALSRARDSGQPPWEALRRLGEQLDLPELVELSTSLQLAGTEGTRIRQSLSARAVALRRHEQADAESEANAVTERLFLPGALLLVGFLLFVGYPACSRILGGF